MTYAAGASAIGVPGWPDLAASTASMASARMVLMLFQASARLGSAAVVLDFLAVLVGGFRRMLLGGGTDRR